MPIPPAMVRTRAAGPGGTYIGDTMAAAVSTNLAGSTSVGFTNVNTYVGGDTWVLQGGAANGLRRRPTNGGGVRGYDFATTTCYLAASVGQANYHMQIELMAVGELLNHGPIFCHDGGANSYGYHFRRRTSTTMQIARNDAVSGYVVVEPSALFAGSGDVAWIRRIGNVLSTRRNAEAWQDVYTDPETPFPGTGVAITNYGNTAEPVWRNLGAGPE